jgi:hypothetical protein
VISLERIATLDVAAASGLCRIGDELIVVADDELTLHRYGLDGSVRGRAVLLPGALPDEPRARKRAKPDFEALTALPDGSLIAFGSGSAPGRERAAWIDLASGSARVVDLGPLYAALRERVRPLNVEGTCAVGDSLLLFTRRTGRAGDNTVVRLDLDATLSALAAGRLDPGLVRGVEPVELFSVGGAPLGFTDAAPWRGGALYAAAAEVTDDPVEDGACVGCELGWIGPDGRVVWREPALPCVKLEGITIDPDGVIHAVADGDDRAVLAPLFRARISP